MLLDSDHKTDVAKALSVFNRIRESGEKQGDGLYFYEGLFAEAGPDGYSICLRDAGARLDIFFHNKFRFESESSAMRQAFLRKVNMIYDEFQPLAGIDD